MKRSQGKSSKKRMFNYSKDYFSKDFVEKISFPRLAGTDGETKVQEILESELTSLGFLDFKKEAFMYTSFFMNILLRIYDPFLGILIILIIVFDIYRLSVLSICFSVLLLILSYFGRTIREKIQFTFTRIGKERTSFNYILTIPPRERNPQQVRNLVILAHYDSMSHELHPLFDGAIYLFGLVGGTFFSLHNMIVIILSLLNVIPINFYYQFYYGFFLATFYCIQLFNKRHNKSFGTADNATGVAAALNVLHSFKNDPLERINLTIVLTGAEEWGDFGADSFIKSHFKDYDKNNTFFLIFDTVGANKLSNLYAHSQGLLPKRKFSPIIEKEIESVLKNKESDFYEIKPFWIPPLIHYSTDHAPLKSFGYEFIVFFSNAPIHSDRDNVRNFSPKMLAKFNQFIIDLLLHLDASLK